MNKKLKEEIMIHAADLGKYCEKAIQTGATHAKFIHPSTVVIAPWVRFKCQFGCSFKHHYNCPPHAPALSETQAFLDSYHRAILFHAEAPYSKERGKNVMAYNEMLVNLEGELFKDGYYKAFVMLAGPCALCKECGIVEGVPCRFPAKTRPSMESCGIDVFQTARNNGFFITTLKEKSETQNLYCLMLVD
jgi:predicted metal-binding protein